VPRSYIHTAVDRCVPPAAQREMVEALPVVGIRTVDASHLAMLSRPRQLADAIGEVTT
jgi:pimeloyl-ACP methyl ester carboxylesterase